MRAPGKAKTTASRLARAECRGVGNDENESGSAHVLCGLRTDAMESWNLRLGEFLVYSAFDR